MTLGLKTPSSPLRLDEGGTVRIGKSRVTLDTIVEAFNQGFPAEEIAQQFTAVSLVDVYATIAYYLQNQAELDAYLAERNVEAEALRKEIEKRWPPKDLRERLLKRKRSALD